MLPRSDLVLIHTQRRILIVTVLLTLAFFLTLQLSTHRTLQACLSPDSHDTHDATQVSRKVQHAVPRLGRVDQKAV